MKLFFDSVKISRDGFTLSVNETFQEGLHLFSGKVGSGKTTLALAAAGLLAPDAGVVRHDGFEGRPVLLMQFPEYHVTGSTVSEEIASWKVFGTEEPFGLLGVQTSDRDPITLSRGELRRLELACVFSREQDLLILDEPYASLDKSAKPILTTLLEKRRGTTLVFSHETENVPDNAEHWRISTGGVHHE
ncbi:Energy-coupling factor transporter ATP-binding protein EcfA1 [Methanocorpusculaceae archaeon Sp1]|nr:Energy-coupling factor transporter ATP-binding protein EcfA1 [Methanocorpusculaceae archaeon Sp1]